MKNPMSPQARIYFSEVLGIKHYLCPESIYNLRSLDGGLPCKVLSVVFQPLSYSQKRLLKKIMASVNIYDYTILEIKKTVILRELFSCEEKLAKHIFFFGGEERVKELPAIEGKSFSDFSDKKELFKHKPTSFLQLFSLDKLDGNSLEIINNKKQVWTKLQEWKQQSGY